MGKYSEKIRDESLWLTATPTPAALAMPFYITEAGHFYAEPDYAVDREQHDSYLFMYTQKGCGTIQSDDSSVELPVGSAIVIDCHKKHHYDSGGGPWEFLWMHINGNTVKTFFDILYPNGIFAVAVSEPEKLGEKIDMLLYKVCENEMQSTIRSSAGLHDLLNTLIEDSLKNAREKNRGRYHEYAEHAVELIRRRYTEFITIDDIMTDIPLSKHHFIRVFKQIMGTTPYNFLTNHRINSAKIFLRTTDISVSEIAGKCGFSDTSNFISQFKKHTGQKPLEYRRYFRFSFMLPSR